MWPDIPNNAILLLTFKGTCYGQRIMNTFGYQVFSVTGAVQPADAFYQAFFADADYADFQDDYLACLPSDYTLDEAWLQYLFPFRIRKAVLEVNLPGDILAPALVQSQASISRHAIEASRRSNGGVRLLMPEGALYSANGLISAGHKVTLDTFAQEMDNEINITVNGTAYLLKPVIIHPGNTPGVFSATEVVATNTQDQLRTMRRRVVGRGE